MPVLSLVLVFEVQTEHWQGFTELCIFTFLDFMLLYALNKQVRTPAKAVYFKIETLDALEQQVISGFWAFLEFPRIQCEKEPDFIHRSSFQFTKTRINLYLHLEELEEKKRIIFGPKQDSFSSFLFDCTLFILSQFFRQICISKQTFSLNRNNSLFSCAANQIQQKQGLCLVQTIQ